MYFTRQMTQNFGITVTAVYTNAIIEGYLCPENYGSVYTR